MRIPHPARLVLGALASALVASPALAIDTSFYTYDGFAETVDAFKLVALIFADPRYSTLVAIIAAAGISIGAVIASVRGHALSLVGFGFQMLVGIGLYVGMIATTGTVNVYDQVRNAYQPVGGVPNLLVVVAGTTNLMERAMTEVIDDNTLDPDSKVTFGAGGHAFDLFFNAVSPEGPITDSFLDATIKDYVRQCYPVARVSPAYSVDDDKLFRTTTDLPGAFAAMAGPSTYATVYTATDKGGTTMSCADAWSHISGALQQPTLFDSYTKRVCERTGFDATNTTQLARCKAQLGEMGSMMTGAPLSAQALITDVLLGNVVGDVLFEDSPSMAARVMANRAVISSGLATMSVANQWMPTLRATVFAIMLFMVPIALLFILTPINLRVASFALGLFVFVALWGVIDAGIYQLTLGRAMDALAEMRGNATAANAWLLAPTAAQKALAIFGSFRTAAAGLSAAFVFTVFRFSGGVFSAITGGSRADLGAAASASAGMATTEGRAAALEAQSSAFGTAARRGAASSFGDFGDRSSFASNRSFGEAGAIDSRGASPVPGVPAFGIGAADAGRELGGLAPALGNRDLSDPQVARAVQRNAATQAIRQYAESDALRTLGHRYFGEGEAGERAFAAFAQGLVQWKAFGDENAHAMMMDGATRNFERLGYSKPEAELKAANVIADAGADPMFAKVAANAFDQQQMLANDMTGAETNIGAMAGRRDYAGDHVAAIERGNVATEQARRAGSNQGQRDAAHMLGLSVSETARRIGFIEALSGEARSSAISQLAKSTGRNEAQVEHALERYNAATQVGTADGATREAAREGTSLYGRSREGAGYDFAERSGKLDAQREVGPDGTRSAARIGEERHQAENEGFEAGAAAAGVGVREAAHLDSFIRTLGATAGNQVNMGEGGAAGVADRARNARTIRIVDDERLTRMQGLLRAHGITMARKDLALAQNGDLGMNVSARAAGQLRRAGLINESQWGAIANGGHARFSFSANDVLVSSSAGFEQSARSDTSTKFEAGKQAGPDTIEQMLGGGAEGHARMAQWLKGGFEMDRKGQWRLKPQVADTLERDITAMMAQTGWKRAISRSADDQTAMGTDINADIGTSTSARSKGGKGAGTAGFVSASAGFRSTDRGQTSESAQASIDITNYDVRAAIANAEVSATKSVTPETDFTGALSQEIMGSRGYRNRLLEQADAARGTADIEAPITSFEQSTILSRGRFADDLPNGPFDGNPEWKERKDR
jgi:conjugal transfer mating pair stabilization protein TraG